MSTVLDRATTPADRLRTSMAAVRVSISWFGTRKSLTVEQKAEAAEPFNAKAKFLSAGKKLLDISHPAFKKVTAVRGKVIAYWKSSLPYPEPGIRLIRQDRVEDFAAKMREFQAELTEAVEALDRNYNELKFTARQKLGNLYNASDYPVSLVGVFASSMIFPASSRRITCSNLTRSFTRKSASVCSRGSTRPCGWPRRRSPPSWPS